MDLNMNAGACRQIRQQLDDDFHCSPLGKFLGNSWEKLVGMSSFKNVLTSLTQLQNESE